MQVYHSYMILDEAAYENTFAKLTMEVVEKEIYQAHDAARESLLKLGHLRGDTWAGPMARFYACYVSMEWAEKIIDIWFRAAALIFTGAMLLISGLLVITNLWLVPLGLAIIAVIYWLRQLANDQPPRPPDLIDKVGQGVTSLLALFATGIALVMGLALLVTHPWLIIFSLAAFWLWRKGYKPAKSW